MQQGTEMIAGSRFERCSGFTLIELLITIAVAVILATVAVPGFQNLMASNRLAADFNEIMMGINSARSEALKRRQDVTASIADAGGVWSISVSYLKEDGSSEVILEREARDSRVAISPKTIVFNALGRLESCLPEPDAGECLVTVGESAREIVISPMGRIAKREVGDG